MEHISMTSFCENSLLPAMSALWRDHLSARQCSSIQDALVFDINILQGSVATYLRFSGMFND